MIIDIGNKKIKINKDVLTEIYKRRQLNIEDCEVGGMLIGSIIKYSYDIVIEDLTTPMEGDFCSRTRYIRSENHNKLLEKKWIDSQYTKMYFGEWHTHHQDNPYYSFQDLTNWKKLMKKSETSTDLLVFLIAGISSFKIWIGDRTKITIRQIYEGDYSGFKMD